MAEIRIANEKDAFDLIQRALQNEMPDQVQNIVFDNWPKLTVTLKGKGYDGTITPSLMEGLVDFQHGLDRTFAKIVYNQDNAAHLKKTDRKEIEFKAKVTSGSSVIEVNLSDLAQRIALELIGKMEPTHIVIMAVAGMALWVGKSVYKKHMELASHDKDVSEDTKKSIALTQEETRRWEIHNQALSVEPRLRMIERDVNNVMLSLLKGVSDADSISINDVEIEQTDAIKIAGNKRAAPEEKQINGNYLIRSVDMTHTEEIKIKVRHVESGREFFARFKDHSLDQNQLDLLRDAEWSREKVYLSVNATQIRSEITKATIISVSAQPKSGA